MYIRFGAGILLVVAISIAGVAVEKEILSTKRELSHQAYREEILLERHRQARMRVEEITSPDRVVQQQHHQRFRIGSTERSGTNSLFRSARNDSELRTR